jgi:CBS-domain-containing membrane protein
VAEPIAIQSAALLCAAIVYHAITGHRYPHVANPSSGKGAAASAAASHEGFTRADLEAVLCRREELLDIDPDDLESLFPTFSCRHGHHHIPVLDAKQRLAGMITQADLIAGMFRQAYAEQRRTA